MEFVTVRLPADLCRAVEEKLIGSSEKTVEELVIQVLEELTQDVDKMDADEEQLLVERLKELGYL